MNANRFLTRVRVRVLSSPWNARGIHARARVPRIDTFGTFAVCVRFPRRESRLIRADNAPVCAGRSRFESARLLASRRLRVIDARQRHSKQSKHFTPCRAGPGLDAFAATPIILPAAFPGFTVLNQETRGSPTANAFRDISLLFLPPPPPPSPVAASSTLTRARTSASRDASASSYVYPTDENSEDVYRAPSIDFTDPLGYDGVYDRPET